MEGAVVLLSSSAVSIGMTFLATAIAGRLWDATKYTRLIKELVESLSDRKTAAEKRDAARN